MKVLVVASYNNGRFAPFIMEQVAALQKAGVEVEMFGVKGKGIKGYIGKLPELKHAISQCHPDLIHAHYGLCGLLANLQRRVPVVTTYHGSDINVKKNRPLSRMSILLSKHNIFVSDKTMSLVRPHGKHSLIPCGVDLTNVQQAPKHEARESMDLPQDKKYVLFASAFDNAIKNYPLAREAMSLVPDAELLELKGYTRDEVSLLMCAVDCILMTSYSEGSPQVIKEAMACGCPIVSVDVGDVRSVTEDIDGCCICERNPIAISEALEKALEHNRTNGRQRLIELGLTNDIIAEKLISIYNSVL